MWNCYDRAMKIHFTCSTAEFEKYKDNYFAIRSYLISEGHILTRDWLPHTEERLRTGATALPDIKKIYQENIQALKDADLVIIEDTISNFSTGHQVTLALQQRKPTLVLWQGKKHKQFNQMFIHGIDVTILEVVEYDLDDLTHILRRFIEQYRNIRETNRFHLVLNGAERQYLDWVHQYKGISRTEAIKQAIHKAIVEDEKYRKYLG